MTIGSKKRRGHSLVELVVAMTSATLLMAGLSSAVVVAAKAFRPETTAAHTRADAAFAQQQVLADLRLATGFTERTDKAATFTVPDRDGDGWPDTLRYAWSGTSGDPLTLSYNGGAAYAVATDVRAFTLSYLMEPVAAAELPGEQTGEPILLLVNNSQNLTSDEVTRRTLFESWNFRVQVRGLNDGTNSILAAAAQNKAIYASGTLDANSFSGASSVAGLSLGIVNEHPLLVNAFGFAASSTIDATATQVNVVDVSHHITTGQVAGNVAVTSQPTIYSLAGTLAGNLNALARLGASPSAPPALATVDAGELLNNGQPAAGRRVNLPWGGASCNPSNWNTTGQTLTRKAMEWAAGIGDDSSQIKRFGYESIFASSTGNANLQYCTRATLNENARLLSISAYVGAVANNLRFAIYADANGQPGARLAQTNVGASTATMAWVTLDTPQIDLPPGNYWLAIAFANSKQRLRQQSGYTNAASRNRSYNAVANGFINPWGNSTSSSNHARSIYATYQVLP